jgi:hypothetical protein
MAKKVKLPPGTWLERDLFQSKAYLSLRGFAPQLLTLLLAKRQFSTVGKKGHEKKICLNCDSLVLTYIEAEKKYGITKPRLTRGYDELLAKGFLTCKHQGGAYKQDKSVYALSEQWRIWRPGSIIEKREIDTVQRGFRKPKRRLKVA